jgi:hypothetical protein
MSSGYRSFSASSRNSSGTDRDSPNMTDPYPTASHPNRSRIRSIARSAVHRAIPRLVPGRRFSSSSPSGNSSCIFQCFSSCDRRSPAARCSPLRNDRRAPRELRGCLRRFAGKSSSDSNLPKYEAANTDLSNVFQICSRYAFGLASSPVSLKPSRPDHCRERETNPGPSLSHCQGSSASWAKNPALCQSQNCLTRYRLADSRTGGLELLNL